MLAHPIERIHNTYARLVLAQNGTLTKIFFKIKFVLVTKMISDNF